MKQTPEFDPIKFLSLQSKRPPLWLRLNQPEQSTDVVNALSREGYAPLLAHPGTIALPSDVRLNNLAAYHEGVVEIQDLASQAIGDAVAPEAHHLVWDACAGGGGKTLQIAAKLRGRGAVYASDIRGYKLDEIRRRANRAGFHHVHTFGWDGTRAPSLPAMVKAQGGFDRVLVDAPCTGSGTWRRNPDARFRATPAAVTEFTQLQLRILQAAESTVRPGGLLIYGTCSWFVAENEGLVASFLAAYPRWQLQHQSVLGAPKHNSDTMYVAVLSCKSP